jgi:hypothetical protein
MLLPIWTDTMMRWRTKFRKNHECNGCEGVHLPSILRQNHLWAKRVRQADPNFFEKLTQSQNPSILWIGCSDSRVPPTQILNLQPGDIFVHRNVGNLVYPDDPNVNAVIDYAVTHLHVQHIILCVKNFDLGPLQLRSDCGQCRSTHGGAYPREMVFSIEIDVPEL